MYAGILNPTDPGQMLALPGAFGLALLLALPLALLSAAQEGDLRDDIVVG